MRRYVPAALGHSQGLVYLGRIVSLNDFGSPGPYQLQAGANRAETLPPLAA